MGFTEAKITIRNPQGGPARELTLLVDSGALYSLVPSSTLGELGIEPEEEEESFQMANGEVIGRKVGEARFSVGRKRTTSKVIFGEEGDMPVLSVVTLESLGLELDPIRRELRSARLLLI
ncbi:MAG: aspartyl protease family protein [Chloroflexi bacterium]|nr:aspartyl protease family protein [Chloroflexota bacterium]